MIFALLLLGACAAVRYDTFLSDWNETETGSAFFDELSNGTVPFPTAATIFFDDGSPAPSLRLGLIALTVSPSAVPTGSVGVSMFVKPIPSGQVRDRPLLQLSGSGTALITVNYNLTDGRVSFKSNNASLGSPVPASTTFNHVFVVLNASGGVQLLTVNGFPVSNAPRSPWTSALLPRISIGGGFDNAMLIDNVCVFTTDAIEDLDAIRFALNRGQRPPTPRPPMTAPPTPAIAPAATGMPTPRPQTPTPTPRPTPASPPPRPIAVPTPQPTPAPPTPRPTPTPESFVAPATSVTQSISDAVPLQTTTIGATSTSLLATASNTSESASTVAPTTIAASSAAVMAARSDAALIGGAVGGAAAVLLAGGIVFCVCRARRAQRRARPAGDVAAAGNNELRQSNYGAAGLAAANVYDVGNVAASNEYGRVGAAAEPRYSSPAVLQQQATGIQAKQTGVGTEYSSL